MTTKVPIITNRRRLEEIPQSEGFCKAAGRSLIFPPFDQMLGSRIRNRGKAAICAITITMKAIKI